MAKIKNVIPINIKQQNTSTKGTITSVIPVQVEPKQQYIEEDIAEQIIPIQVYTRNQTYPVEGISSSGIPVAEDNIESITDMQDETIEWIIKNSGVVKNYDEFLTAIREVLIRFNTEPKRYSKEDYLKLIQAVVSCFKHLYSQDISAWSVTEWSEILSDDKVPTEKLVKETIDLLDNRLSWIRYCDPEDTEDENEQ